VKPLEERVGKTVGKHFVSLSCLHKTASGDQKVHVFSGFMVDVLGEWFYVTAGHILSDIQSALSNGSTFEVWRLGDQTAGNRFNGSAVPYAFDAEKWLVIQDDKGLDYALTHIGWPYREQLEAGGVVALPRSVWADHLLEHDHWALVGIPSETVSYDGVTNIHARFVMVPLTPLDQTPEQAGDRAQNQFYAKLSTDSEHVVRDVVGMSGGPVFSLKLVNGTWRYHVIGIQSAWYPASRTLAICPFSTFAEEIERIVGEVLSKMERSTE
jgi:hypothetical protein